MSLGVNTKDSANTFQTLTPTGGTVSNGAVFFSSPGASNSSGNTTVSDWVKEIAIAVAAAYIIKRFIK